MCVGNALSLETLSELLTASERCELLDDAERCEFLEDISRNVNKIWTLGKTREMLLRLSPVIAEGKGKQFCMLNISQPNPKLLRVNLQSFGK